MNPLALRSLFCAVIGLTLVASAFAAANIARTSWPAETLTGTVMTVNPNSDLVVVQSPDRVPFDMRITRSTRIESGDRTLTLADLTAEKNHSVSVTFVPTERGDIARVMRIMD